jgi:2'-5' RNA ligase
MRFGLYYAPARGEPLSDLGERWLARSARDEDRREPPIIEGLTRVDFADATETPRRYGFHATLKPPFRLAEGALEVDLLEAAARFAGQARPCFVNSLELRRIGAFLALTPAHPSPELNRLAAEVVEAFDRLRAAPAPANWRADAQGG